MKRRQFLFWVSASLFGIGETLRMSFFDRVAAAAINFGGQADAPAHDVAQKPPSGKAIDFNSRPAVSQQYYSNHSFPMGPVIDNDVDDPTNHGKTAPNRLARQGRPPSRWLRSLSAEELRQWMVSVNLPYTPVTGMSYWTHLTRDHLFSADKIAGLTINEQAKLHDAAHAGY